jgi:hypothetical protein
MGRPWIGRKGSLNISGSRNGNVAPNPCTGRGRTHKQTKNSVALSPQANYTDSAIATCRRNLVPTFVDWGVSRGQRGGFPTVLNLISLDRSRYSYFQAAPHLSSQGLSGHRYNPTGIQKIWKRRESNPGPLSLQPGTLSTRPQRWSWKRKLWTKNKKHENHSHKNISTSFEVQV